MFQGYTDEAFEFFMAIRFNNNRSFFQDNREWYQRAVREPSITLAQQLADHIEKIDPNLERRPHRVVSRINRDIRFARDKSPYRDRVWLSFHHTEENKGKLPGLYFEFNDEIAVCGTGFYRGNKPLMDALRRQILARPREAMDIFAPILREYHLYTIPSARISIPEAVPFELQDLYAARSFYFEKTIPDFDLIRSPRLADELTESFKRLTPLYRYIIDLVQET